MMFGIEAAHRDDAGDLFLRLERQHVIDEPTRRGAALLGDVVDLEPVDLAAIGETQQVSMRRSDEEVLDEVIVACGAARDTLAATMLAAVGVERQALDVAVMAYGDDVGLFLDQVLHVDPAGLAGDL